MSPREIWCNEAQERYVLGIAPHDLKRFRAICERERCPFAVLGTASADGQLIVLDPELGAKPVDLSMDTLLGKPPIEYLTGWRIQLAADRLRNGRDGIARIAGDVGYESEAAFNRAFKRVTGMTPGKWREGGGDSRPHMPLYFREPLGPPPNG